MHLGDPVSQAVENHAAHDRLIGVQRVSGAAVIGVMRAVLVEDVVHLVGEAAEAEGGSRRISLGGVVVDDVEDHLDARAMQRLDEIAELVDRAEGVLARTVAGMRREERNRRISPIIDQTRRTVLPVELEYRQQLHSGDPEILEIRDLFDHPCIGPSQLRGNARTRMARKAGDMHLVDDRGGKAAAAEHRPPNRKRLGSTTTLFIAIASFSPYWLAIWREYPRARQQRARTGRAEPCSDRNAGRVGIERPGTR